MKKLIVLLLLVTACSSADNGAYEKSKTVENRLSKSVPKPWSKIDNEGSDFALNSKNTNSFFLFNSACRKFDSSNLDVLTNSILAGVNNVEYIERTTTTHDGRNANLVVAKGSMDGVERYFRILTTQKNGCIYDFALISTTMQNLEKDTADFNNFLQQIKLN